MPGLLDGIRVVELGIALVGPWAAKQLGALGADVIKLEDPAGEMLHRVPPYIHGTSAVYISANLNKRNMTLDLKDPKGLEAALRLLDTADVFIENMRPGTVKRLGLSYEDLVVRNPRIICVSASAYGATGPMSGFAGADGFVQAFCGWCSITGAPGTEGEMVRYPSHMDNTAATVITESVLQALVARERTGQGQQIEIDMLSAALSIQSTRIAEFFATGQQPQPMGSATATTVPHEAFRCQDQIYLAVGVIAEDQWPRFCEAMQLTELLAEPRFATNPLRVANRDVLVPLLAERFASKPSIWWTQRLLRQRVPHARTLDTTAMLIHPQVTANGFIEQIDTPHWGRITVEAAPWQFHGTPLDPQRAGGLKGEHNDEVLGELAAATPKMGG